MRTPWALLLFAAVLTGCHSARPLDLRFVDADTGRPVENVGLFQERKRFFIYIFIPVYGYHPRPIADYSTNAAGRIRTLVKPGDKLTWRDYTDAQQFSEHSYYSSSYASVLVGEDFEGVTVLRGSVPPLEKHLPWPGPNKLIHIPVRPKQPESGEMDGDGNTPEH